MSATSVKEQPSPSSSSSQQQPPTVVNWRTLGLDVDKAEMQQMLSLHGDWSRSQYEESLALYERFLECADSYVAPLIRDALSCLDHAYRLYGPQSVVCSYNGGKDAVVILHLVRAAHANHFRNQQKGEGNNNQQQQRITRPRVVYFDHEREFPEILSLLHTTTEAYDLDMIAFQEGIKFNEGLTLLVENNLGVSISSLPISTTSTLPIFPMAFVLGTRSTDPNAGNQGQFAPSSSYMPPFMRVNPVLEWTYGHVWHFLRLFQLPYCRLYDQGYTSLGTTLDTLPCPALEVAGSSSVNEGEDGDKKGRSNGAAVPKYWPAYMLRDWDQERAGRIQKKPKGETKKSTTSTVVDATSKSAQPSNTKSNEDEEQISTITDLGATSRAPLPDTTKGETGQQETAAATTAKTPVNVANDTDEDEDDAAFASIYSPSECSDSFQRSVGLLIIGDEILKGMCADANIPVAAQALRNQNVHLSKVVVVSDCQDDIVEEIKRLHRSVDVIITSGGIGPTHDDVTIKSVAAALGKDMVLHDKMAQLLREKMNTKKEDGAGADTDSGEEKEEALTDAQIKMATLPSNAKLRYLSPEKGDWPTLQCSNIFILPGIPQFFSKKMVDLAEYLSSQFERSITYKVVLTADETTIVPALNAVVERHPNVIFGSYPFVGQPDVKTVVTLEGRMVESAISATRNSSLNIMQGALLESLMSKEKMDRNVKVALDDLIKELPEDSILRVDNDDGVLFS